MAERKTKVTVRISEGSMAWLKSRGENQNGIIRSLMDEAMELDGTMEARNMIRRGRVAQAQTLLEEALRLLEDVGVEAAGKYTRKALDSLPQAL